LAETNPASVAAVRSARNAAEHRTALPRRVRCGCTGLMELEPSIIAKALLALLAFGLREGYITDPASKAK